jgi:hypothetical protein
MLQGTGTFLRKREERRERERREKNRSDEERNKHKANRRRPGAWHVPLEKS